VVGSNISMSKAVHRKCVGNRYTSILRVNSDITTVEGSKKVNGGYIMLQNKVVFVEFITGYRCEGNHVIYLSVV